MLPLSVYLICFSAVSLVSFSVSLLLCIRRTSVRSNEEIRTKGNLAYSTHSSPAHDETTIPRDELGYDYVFTDRFTSRAQTAHQLTAAGLTSHSAIERAGGSVQLTSSDRKADFEELYNCLKQIKADKTENNDSNGSVQQQDSINNVQVLSTESTSNSPSESEHYYY